MKKLFAIIFFLLFISDIFLVTAQRKDTDAKIELSKSRTLNRRITDTAEIRVLYAFNAEDMEDVDTWIDEGQLKIGNGFTQYDSHFLEVNEDSVIAWWAAHPKADAYPWMLGLRGYNNAKWIEYQSSAIIVKDTILEEWCTMPRSIYNDNKFYREVLPLQAWEIGTETSEVCGYSCIEATCRWRGRDYVAWFTPEIPVPAGPWKFGGLPGLILKVADADNIYVWEAVAINKGNFPVYAPRAKKYSQTTREKLIKLQRSLNENYIKATDATVFDARTGQQITSRPHQYTPLELE